jgi:cytochrome oxidase Cu insertion factor (SCO1/SenC/PrrC family)
MDELKKMYDNYARDQVEIISINIDPRESSEEINEFIRQYAEYFGYELNWVFGNEYDDLSKYQPSNSIPTLVIFDQKGNVQLQHSGRLYFSEYPDNWPYEKIILKDIIDELIK